MRIIGFLIILSVVICSYHFGQIMLIYKLTKCPLEDFIKAIKNIISCREDVEIREIRKKGE